VEFGHKHVKVGQLVILAQKLKMRKIEFTFLNFKAFNNSTNSRMYLLY